MTTITTSELGDKLQDLFDSSHCAFYPEEDELFNLENKFVNQSVEDNSTIILQHTFFISIMLAMSLSISKWIYRNFYYIPSQKYDPNMANINIIPTAVVWFFTTFITMFMFIIAGFYRTPIFFVWGTGIFIMFISILFKIFLTENNYRVGSADLGLLAKLLSFNTYSPSLLSILLKILICMGVATIGVLFIMDAFKNNSKVSYIVFGIAAFIVYFFPLGLIYYTENIKHIFERNSL